MSIMFRDPFQPIKKLEPGPNIYDTRKLPSEVNIHDKGFGDIHPLYKQIDNQSIRNLPFILSIKLENENSPEIHSVIQKTGQVFYFTINTKNDKTFRYLGKSNEANKEKKKFLQTFFEANHGSACAQAELADMYADGRGVTKNEREAIKYYALSIKQAKSTLIWLKYLADDHGNAIAQAELALYTMELKNQNKIDL